MEQAGYTIFATAIGHCGLAWGERGVVAVQLPERDAEATRARLVRGLPRALPLDPPPAVQRARRGIAGLIAGADDDLADVVLDLTGVAPFHQRVYALAREIRPGRTRTYGELATELGEPGAARAVGQALGANPFPIVVPCHRIVAAGGRSGGFSAGDGVATKLRLLDAERVHGNGVPSLF